MKLFLDMAHYPPNRNHDTCHVSGKTISEANLDRLPWKSSDGEKDARKLEPAWSGSASVGDILPVRSQEQRQYPHIWIIHALFRVAVSHQG